MLFLGIFTTIITFSLRLIDEVNFIKVLGN
jgi:hypothetical protein